MKFKWHQGNHSASVRGEDRDLPVSAGVQALQEAAEMPRSGN